MSDEPTPDDPPQDPPRRIEVANKGVLRVAEGSAYTEPPDPATPPASPPAEDT